MRNTCIYHFNFVSLQHKYSTGSKKMKTNKDIYAGDPNIAVRQIVASSEVHRMCYEKCERLKDAIYRTPEGSPERRKKIEKLNFHSRQYRQLLEATEYIYELFRTVPRLSPHMAEAERCFLNSDFAGMDDALPEEEIMAEINRLKQEQDSANWDETELLLEEKSYELILKGLLHYTHTDHPEWYKDLWRSLTEALEASGNTHTLYYNGWYSLLYMELDKAEEFYTDATDERWMGDDLTDESKRFFKARCLRHLSYLSYRKGDLTAAIRSMQQTLKLYTELKDEKPAAYLPAVAKALAILGDYHTQNKAYTVALMEYEEALRIRRRLAVDDSEAYLPLVSELLDAVGAMHMMKEEYKDAIARFEEAISIKRSFLEFDKQAVMDMLAVSLDNLATAYYVMNRREELIPLLTEVAALHRELAVTEPDVHQPKLARALCKVAAQHRNWKENKEAYRDMTEGIAIYRECARQSPAEYLPSLGEKLEELDGWCWYDKKYAEAIEACREGTEVCRRLAEESPEKYLPKLGETLNRLAAMYYDTGDYEPSLAIYLDGVEVSRKLVERDKRYGHILGCLLTGLGAYYTDIFPDREKALAAVREACAILRPLRRQNPECEKAYNKATGMIRAWEQ
jgi:hypothetical protein